ncbi:hypothetical protein KKE78_01580 [Patescibacteria group bacterium]|nr:hypothetical protein [Patescibacteria group bacterium]
MKILEQIKNQIQSNETVSLLVRKKKAILIILILVLGIMAGVYLVRQQQILKSRAATGRTVIRITPAINDTIVETNTSEVQIQIDKGSFGN